MSTITERLRAGFGGIVPTICDEAANRIEELERQLAASSAPVEQAAPPTEAEIRAEFHRQHSGRNLKQHYLRGTYIAANIAALWNQHVRTVVWMNQRANPPIELEPPNVTPKESPCRDSY